MNVSPQNRMNRVNLVIADHDEITRIGLRHVLDRLTHFTVLEVVEDGHALLSALENSPANVVLMDIALPKIDGFEATRQLKKRFPDIKVIILSYFDTQEKITLALEAGADAYCMKTIGAEKLQLAIESVLEGALWLDPVIAKKVVSILSMAMIKHPATIEENHIPASKKADLTEREFEVLTLIAKGKSNKEIGLILEISPYTVKSHIRNLTQKLSVEDRTQAAVKALQEGLLSI